MMSTCREWGQALVDACGRESQLHVNISKKLELTDVILSSFCAKKLINY